MTSDDRDEPPSRAPGAREQMLAWMAEVSASAEVGGTAEERRRIAAWLLEVADGWPYRATCLLKHGIDDARRRAAVEHVRAALAAPAHDAPAADALSTAVHAVTIQVTCVALQELGAVVLRLEPPPLRKQPPRRRTL